MPTITEMQLHAAEVRRGDLVYIPSYGSNWGKVDKIRFLIKNIEFTLGFGEGFPNYVARYNPERVMTVKRSEQTVEEKRYALVDTLQAAIDKFLPWGVEPKEGLEALWAQQAERLVKSGPAYYLTWYAQDDAKAEHVLNWKLNVVAWVNRRETEGVGKLSMLDVGDIIVEAREQLVKEMLSWYGPRSSSGGSNLNALAKWEAMRELLNSGWELSYIVSMVKKVHEVEATIHA